MSTGLRVSALARNRLILVPALPWQDLGAATTPSAYEVRMLTGTTLTVTSVVASPSGALTLTLGSDLPFNETVHVLVSQTLQFINGDTPPSVLEVTWTRRLPTLRIPLSTFTGGANQQPLSSTPSGVFFGSALDEPVAGTSMQVDAVSLCVTNADKYTFPPFRDPRPLTTWGPLGWTGGTLNSAGFTAAGGSRFLSVDVVVDFGVKQTESLAPATDGKLTVTFNETYTSARVALLNNAHWTLYGTGGGTPFICADNLTLIPPGSTTVIPLVP